MYEDFQGPRAKPSVGPLARHGGRPSFTSGRKHFINLFIWPADTESLHNTLYNQDGYHGLDKIRNELSGRL